MSQKSQRNKTSSNQSQTFDTSHNKSHSDKRTSRFLASIEQEEVDNPEKAFFILLDACSELIQLHSDTNKQEIDAAIKQNQTFEQVAKLVHQKMLQLRKDYVTSEYQIIQLKESIVQKQQLQQQSNTFEAYQKLHEQNQRWKQLYFQEARQVIEITKQQRQMATEIQQQLEYISILEQKHSSLEEKYLQLFEQVHSSRDNIDVKKYCNALASQINEKNELLSVQLQNSRKQCVELSKKLQDEIMKVQAAQELRIIDMQYIMGLENNMEEQN